MPIRPGEPVRPDRVRADSLDAENPAGDRIQVHRIKFRCGGCNAPAESVVAPTHPHVAKYRCRLCDYVTEVETHESVWTDIEGAMEEGAHNELMKKRTTNSQIVTKPATVESKHGFTVIDRRSVR